MDKIKLIYNPNAGDRKFKEALDDACSIFQGAGYELSIFRTACQEDIGRQVARLDDNYKALIISGGDGTINYAINALLRNEKDIPLGIIPSGTANDFAQFIGLPKDPARALEAMAHGEVAEVDVGLANDRYFINVCGAGLFANISHNMDGRFKASFGKMAYYMKTIGEMPNFEPFSVKISHSRGVMHEDIYMFLALNSSGAGGFDRLAPDASIYDGRFDFVAFRACSLLELGRLFFKVLKHNYIDDPNTIYLQDSLVTVECIDSKSPFGIYDVDGELGGELPVTIKTVHKGLRLLIPKQKG